MGEIIYFVSDTHLGDGSSADRFRYPAELLDLLARIRSEPAAHLVLLGDILELWTCSLELIMVRHAPILQEFIRLARTHPVTYVVGNHDCLPWYYYLGQTLGQVRITEEFRAAQGRLVALHGHQFDPLNRVSVTEEGKVLPPWTRKVVQILGIVERAGGERTGNTVSNIAERFTPAADQLARLLLEGGEDILTEGKKWFHTLREILRRQSPGERDYPPDEGLYESGAHRLMRAGARFVVMGHTHHPVVRIYGTRQYVNTGSWTWNRYPPTYARYADGQLELLDATTHRPYMPPPLRP